jgi:hypothetical protein
MKDTTWVVTVGEEGVDAFVGCLFFTHSCESALCQELWPGSENQDPGRDVVELVRVKERGTSRMIPVFQPLGQVLEQESSPEDRNYIYLTHHLLNR